MMEKRFREQSLQFYQEHLFNDIMRFWLNNAIDYEDGGYYICFNITGDKLISTDKYVWPQGRFIWILSKLAELTGEHDKYLSLAKLGVDFLKENCFLENGNCAFLLTKTGDKKEYIPGAGYDISFYADCFVALGFSKYAEMTKDREILELALDTYDSLCERVNTGTFLSEPYPLRKGYKAHGVPMITFNTGQALVKALTVFKHDRIEEIRGRITYYVQDIMNNFVKDGYILEMIGEDNKVVDSILGSFINPGHTLEDMWFVLHYAIEKKDQDLIKKVVDLSKNAFEIGWDKEYGGLFQYVGLWGGEPTGKTNGLEDDKMVEKLWNNWDNKLWWVHSETLYTLLLGYELTGDESLLNYYKQVYDYTFKTFPNPDRKVGEWIQIRDRQGKPVQKVVTLPVKDPFHISRNLILLIELLKGKVF